MCWRGWRTESWVRSDQKIARDVHSEAFRLALLHLTPRELLGLRLLFNRELAKQGDSKAAADAGRLVRTLRVAQQFAEHNLPRAAEVSDHEVGAAVAEVLGNWPSEREIVERRGNHDQQADPQ